MSFYTEPIIKCEKCGIDCHAEWVDNGFGPYAVQAGPYHCYECGWTEVGCPQDECIKQKCISWSYCKGDALKTGSGPGEKE